MSSDRTAGVISIHQLFSDIGSGAGPQYRGLGIGDIEDHGVVVVLGIFIHYIQHLFAQTV